MNSKRRSRPPRVLIIEDDRASYSALQSILLRRGCHVDLATGVSEGIGKLNHELDWIVLDLMLPDGDGEDVLKELVSQQLPLNVAITTGVTDALRIQSLSLFQPDLVLRKPIDLAALLKALGV